MADELKTLAEMEQEKLRLELEWLRNQVELQKLELRRIRGDVVYSADELERLLPPPGSKQCFLSLETLKRFGLVGGASGYFGGNVLLAIENWLAYTLSQRLGWSGQKGGHFHAFFDKVDSEGEGKIQGEDCLFVQGKPSRNSGKKVHADPRGVREVETSRGRFERLLSAGNSDGKT